YLVAMPLPQVMYNLNFSKDHQASWALSTAPIEDAAGFASGLRKAVVGRFSAPLLVLLFVVLAATWRDVGHAAVQIWCAGCAVWLAAHASSVGAVRATPFAAPLARGESFGPVAPLAAVVGTVVSGLALLHWYAARDGATFVGFTIAITVAAALAGRVTGPMLVRRALRRAGA
ncbi:MAG TPA: hypothetical protein PLV92_14570, partial [Pirellulaceae bacterium]|nr:hypothetical protein [Pirellulaceae bacterium]